MSTDNTIIAGDQFGDEPASFAERVKNALVVLPEAAPHMLTWFRGILTDDRVPWYAKAAIPAAIAYLVSPIDVVPDWIPVAGQLDDAWLIVNAVTFLLKSAGHDVLREHWQGDSETFAALIALASVKR